MYTQPIKVKRRPLRVLSIDLTAKGFGFALLDAKVGLLDWGFCTIRASQDDLFVARIISRIDRGRPTALALENIAPAKGRENAQRRRDMIIRLAAERQLGTCHVSRAIVQRFLGATTKIEIARCLAAQFPELMSRMPRERRLWMTEDERMHIFDALSYAVVIVAPRKATQHDSRDEGK